MHSVTPDQWWVFTLGSPVLALRCVFLGARPAASPIARVANKGILADSGNLVRILTNLLTNVLDAK